MSPVSILRQSSKLSAANLFRILMLFPLDILVARQLGPTLLGIVGFVQLWQLYSSLAKSGVFQAAHREMPALIAAGDREVATRVQNLGVTAESLWLLVPATFMLAGAVFERSPSIRVGLAAGALGFLATQFATFVIGIQYAYQRFGLIARISVVSALASAVFVLSTVWFRSILTPILSPAVGSAVTLVALFALGPPLRLRPTWDRRELRRLLRIGIILTLGTLAYWSFRMVDRTVVAARLPLVHLGYFTFALNFINLGILLVADFIAAAQPKIWTEIARGETGDVGRSLRNLVLSVIFATCVAVNLAQALFGALVIELVPSFRPAISVFEVLAFVVMCGTVGVIPAQVLTAATINRQRTATVLYAIGIPINALLALVAVHAGGGLIGVALASVAAQGVVATAMLVAIRPHVFADGGSRLRFYGSAAALAATSGVVALVFALPALVYGSGPVWRTAIVRVALALGVWAVFGAGLAIHWRAERRGA